MVNASKLVALKDSTLREGLDTSGVSFSVEQKLRIAKVLEQAGVPEIEIAAPSRMMQDLQFASMVKAEKLQVRTSGLVYAYHPRWQTEVEAAAANLDRFDILLPVSPKRKPFDRNEKASLLEEVLDFTVAAHSDVGVGFPHST